MTEKKAMYESNFYFETPEEADPFTTKHSYCHGYNVYQDILPSATWSEYLYLLFQGEKPTQSQAILVEKIAIAIANPGMRDLSVRAAMNAGVGGSAAASSLISALSVGAGQYAGAREVYALVLQWGELKNDLSKWVSFLQKPNNKNNRLSTWDDFQHSPGFEPNSNTCSTTVLSTLNLLSSLSPSENLKWLNKNRVKIENIIKSPLSMTGVIACALYDLGFSPKQSEMLFLILRLPGAAVHALEQEQLGWKKFPFFGKETILTDDPGNIGLPNTKDLTL
jgi:citrate synthase